MNIPTEEQARGIKKYLNEYTLIALTAAVIYLFYMYHSINVFIQTSLMKNNMELMRVIEKNTEALNHYEYKTK